MRLTFLTHFPGKGGSTSLLLQLQEFFQGRGHTTTVLVGQDCPDPIIPAYDVAPQPARGRWRARLEAYRQAVELTRPEVVYSISGKEELSVLRFLRCVRVRQISSLESNLFVDIPYWLRQVSGHVEAITANTPDVLGQIRSYGLAPFAGLVAPYRFDPELLRAPWVSPDAETTRDQPLQICFVGRLESYLKRAHWLPDIIHGARRAGLALHWHLIGDGPSAGAIRERLKRLDCWEQVTFHGWCARADLIRLLIGKDLFFLCSRSEGLPIALVEAMLCGLACVAPAIAAGLTYALAGGGGWLYSATSPRAAVLALHEAAADRRQVNRKKAEAQQRARALFSGAVVDQQLDQLEAGFQRLTYNGHALQINQAPAMRGVRAWISLRRRLWMALYPGRIIP